MDFMPWELEGITSPCNLLIGQYLKHMTLCPPVAIVKRCYGIHLLHWWGWNKRTWLYLCRCSQVNTHLITSIFIQCSIMCLCYLYSITTDRNWRHEWIYTHIYTVASQKYAHLPFSLKVIAKGHLLLKNMPAQQIKIICSSVHSNTVKPPIMDPPTSGQPLYNGHWLWHQLKLLQN